VPKAIEDQIVQEQVAYQAIKIAQDAALHQGSSVTYDSLTQQRERVCFSHWLRPEQLASIARRAPHLQVVAGRHSTAHSHPILNFSRMVAEDRAIKYLCQILGQSEDEYTQWIVDIGGNATRHQSKHRNNVFSCCPILDAPDVLRDVNHKNAINRCNHKAEDCNCVVPSAYLSVDSLYYLTPQTIASLVKRSLNNLFIAVVHDFDDAYGSFGDGEAMYQMVDDHTVTMKVKGNHHSYTHSNLSWLRGRSSLPMVVNGVIGSLVWTKLDNSIDHAIYVFQFTHLTFSTVMSPVMSLNSVIKDPTYYGAVMTGVLGDVGEVSVAGEKVDLPKVTMHSFGPWIFFYRPNETVASYVPKSLVSSAAQQIMGKPRTSETLGTLLAYVRHYSKKINLPPSYLASSCFAAVCVAFVHFLESETTMLYSLVKPHTDLMTVHSRALKLDFDRLWTLKKIAMAAAAASIGFVKVVAPAVNAIAAVVIPALTIIPAAVTTAVAVTGVVASAYIAKCAVDGILSSCLDNYNTKVDPKTVYGKYLLNRGSNVTDFVGPVPLTRLPTTLPSTPMSELLTAEIDETAEVDVEDQTVEKNTSAIYQAGIHSSHNVPILPTPGAHTEFSSVVGRCVIPQPFHDGSFDEKFFQKFEATVLKNMHHIFPGVDEVKAEPFEDWNKRFPGSRQKIQAKSFAEVCQGVDRDWNRYSRELFAKLELLLKSSAEGLVKLTPRAIQGATSHFNVITGPYFAGYNTMLKKIWSVNRTVGPVYTSGSSGEAIGACFERGCDHFGKYAILKGDFERFDSTIHRKLLELEIKINISLKAKTPVVSTLKHAIKTKGYGKHGVSFSVDGTRHSGDSQTSCGNSTLQVVAHYFCLSEHLGITYEECLQRFLIIALGDDVIIIGDEADLVGYDSGTYLRKLGFKFVPKLYTGPNARYLANFCSGRFYPCKDSSGQRHCVLAPNIGRVYSKFGYYANPPQGMDLDRIARGDALSRHVATSMLPCIRHLMTRTLSLTEGKTVYLDKDTRRRLAETAGLARMYFPTEETYNMTKIVYNIGRDEDEAYRQRLSTIPSIPAVCDYQPLRAAAIVDGDLADPELIENNEPASNMNLGASIERITTACSISFAPVQTTTVGHENVHQSSVGTKCVTLSLA